MFAAIAPSYDLNNRLHSFFQDQRWRRRAVKLAMLRPSDDIVDVACGTGDLAIKFRDRIIIKHRRNDPWPRQPVLAIDFTMEMLQRGRCKSCIPPPAGVQSDSDATTGIVDGVAWINGDAQSL